LTKSRCRRCLLLPFGLLVLRLLVLRRHRTEQTPPDPHSLSHKKREPEKSDQSQLPLRSDSNHRVLYEMASHISLPQNCTLNFFNQNSGPKTMHVQQPTTNPVSQVGGSSHVHRVRSLVDNVARSVDNVACTASDLAPVTWPLGLGSDHGWLCWVPSL
jgi:hypothetical protein